MTRHNPQTHKSVLLIAHTSFSQPTEKWEYISPLSIQGVIDEIIVEASLIIHKIKNQLKIFKDQKIISMDLNKQKFI